MGFSLYYKPENICYLIEADMESDKNKKKELFNDFDLFEIAICKLLYAVNTSKNPKKVSDKELRKWCLKTYLEVLLS